MRNHDEKHKDIIESVLPSRARKMARESRRLLHKQARARQRLGLGALGTSDDDGAVDFGEGLRKSRMREMVWDRRSADNVGALTRWAAAVVEEDPTLRDAPLHEQVAYFAGILPSDLIGRHAVQHIELALRYAAGPSSWSAHREQAMALDAELQRAHAGGLREVLEAGKHAELNHELRRAYARLSASPNAGTTPDPLRLLLGLHDVEAFAAETCHRAWVRDVVARVVGP